MDRGRRAKIFAPFDALDGYSESIDSKNVEYVGRIELEEADRIELNRRLQILRSLTFNLQQQIGPGQSGESERPLLRAMHRPEPLCMADVGPVPDCYRDLLEGRSGGDGGNQNR